METRLHIQRSLSSSRAFEGAKIFPSLLIDASKKREAPLCAADQALKYYESLGFFGARSTKNEHGYGGVIRSVNSPPPWVESLKIDEIDEISKERDFQLRSLAQHIQGTSNEALFERFLRHLSGQDETLRKIREQFKKISLDKSLQDQLRISELDEFKSLVALARQLGPVLAEELGEILLNEFGDDPLGYSIGIGAPDLLLWTESDENEFWFFSEVKAHGDYLSSTQKSWLARHWGVVQGHFLLTIIS